MGFCYHFEYKNGHVVEAINVWNFDIDFVNHKTYWIKVKEKPNYSSFCLIADEMVVLIGICEE